MYGFTTFQVHHYFQLSWNVDKWGLRAYVRCLCAFGLQHDDLIIVFQIFYIWFQHFDSVSSDPTDILAGLLRLYTRLCVARSSSVLLSSTLGMQPALPQLKCSFSSQYFERTKLTSHVSRSDDVRLVLLGSTLSLTEPRNLKVTTGMTVIYILTYARMPLTFVATQGLIIFSVHL